MPKKKYFTEEERKQAKTAYRKQYYQDNKEKELEQVKQYQTEHKAEKAAYMKQYFATPIGRAANLVGGYKRDDKNAGRGECTIDAKWIVDNVFSGQVCHYCGESDWTKLGVDRKDSSLPHTPENCVPCCEKCNKKKGTTPHEKYLQKIQKEAS